VWTDGSGELSDSYRNWGAGQPDNLLDGEHCTELIVDSGEWNDQDCAATRLSSICEIRAFALTLPRLSLQVSVCAQPRCQF